MVDEVVRNAIKNAMPQARIVEQAKTDSSRACVVDSVTPETAKMVKKYRIRKGPYAGRIGASADTINVQSDNVGSAKVIIEGPGDSMLDRKLSSRTLFVDKTTKKIIGTSG